MQLMTVEELAKLIHKTPLSIYTDLARNPHRLPPVVRLPGSRRVLFQDVLEWIASHSSKVQSDVSDTRISVETPRRKRGRPSRAELRARRLTSGEAA